ncbi:MAG: ABC transporter permease [Gemmatimonadota bacterium]|nr:ABC transporter permease [Gemmatimonadota bacterium]
MFRGFWKLTWLEAKIFAREPMGFVGSLVVPAVFFVVFGRVIGSPVPAGGAAGAGAARDAAAAAAAAAGAPPFNVAIVTAIIIAITSVQSLVAIMAIYREGGILKRLRATPLSPVTILGSHVTVKLAFTTVNLLILVMLGRRLFPGAMHVNLVSFTAALLLGTLSILSLGFVIASLVPTARFAQPIGAFVLYPMLSVSGLFFPLAGAPGAVRAVAWALPTTHAVALLQGVWDGSGWAAHWPNALALVAFFATFSAIATRVFRWE